MQLKESYYIATNVYSRKSATTFGDLHDWLGFRVAHLIKEVLQTPSIIVLWTIGILSSVLTESM